MKNITPSGETVKFITDKYCANHSPSFGIFKYGTSNIGDEIQSIAAKQFLPFVTHLIDRDNISTCKADVSMIANGWYLHPKNGETGSTKDTFDWPPPPNISPLFISFHISQRALPIITSEKSIAYLKTHQPIGCRDTYTQKILIQHGVDAYFSGCLTLTLGNLFSHLERTENIYFVDVPKKVENRLYQEYKAKPNFLTHGLPGRAKNVTARFSLAQHMLYKYASAKLVITSRIHCALPCLAFNTPVIFVYDETLFAPERYETLLNILPNISCESLLSSANILDTIHKVSTSVDTLKIKNLASQLSTTCQNFIQKETSLDHYF